MTTGPEQKPAGSTPPLPYRIGSEKILKVTSNASNKIITLMQRQNRTGGALRVAVVGGGCSGLQYKMDFIDTPNRGDILIESGGIKVVVDPKSALYVSGSELDFVDKLTDGGFKVRNPNATTHCSCGESFAA